MKLKTILMTLSAIAAVSCAKPQELEMIVVAPGHFHASLLQKNSLEGVSDIVKVYAKAGSELEAYKSTIESFNTREDNPTNWVLDVYEGEDFLEHIPASDGNDFAVFAGNNKLKSDYILHCISKGYHVISDKPMAINADGNAKLQQAYQIAETDNLVIYDLMTERYDVQNEITRALMSDKEIFGEVSGKIEIEDIHHFFKQVAGKPLTRPMWYFDVRQQGEGIADVTTHFIDLIFWECFPGETITTTDVKVTGADRFPTLITLDQYKAVTGADSFPDYLAEDVKDGVLNVYSNGTIDFEVKGIPVSILMRWDYAPEAGSGDRFHEVISGSISSLEIVQDASTGFSRRLFINTTEDLALKAEALLKATWPQVALTKVEEGKYVVDIPAEYKHPHEEHFSMVGQDFINAVRSGSMPEWEKQNTLTKYHITTTAVSMASDE
jgi:predicted dehydrogenase